MIPPSGYIVTRTWVAYPVTYDEIPRVSRDTDSETKIITRGKGEKGHHQLLIQASSSSSSSCIRESSLRFRWKKSEFDQDPVVSEEAKPFQ